MFQSAASDCRRENWKKKTGKKKLEKKKLKGGQQFSF